ncbi:MAG: hypothetical protein ACHREM_03980 [Polyangiales bacterium]
MSVPAIVPMSVSGVRHLVERAYRESGDLQYLRELLVNAIEAGATRIEFGPEWSAVESKGVYRLMVADNGKGMSPEQLLTFLNTFGGGGKPIGDAHENFGVGAKTSLLPWNHEGVVVISWTEDQPLGAMVWLMRDAASGEYGARKFDTADGFEEVVTPFDEWSRIKPSWITDHGTIVVCLGNSGREDTFLGKSGEGDIKGIAAYLNKRVWEIPDGVEVAVQEVRTEKRAEWPRSLEEATSSRGPRPWNRRQIRGARHYVTMTEDGDATTNAQRGTVALADGTELDWYLWQGDRPKVHSYAHMKGYIAALYRNELYDQMQHVSNFRTFGIPQKEVRERLTIIARPPQASGAAFGVYPDTARNSLKLQATKRAGESLPWADWAQEFAERMPAPIREALAVAGPSRTGTLDDERWKDRLADDYGKRWASARYVASEGGSDRIEPALGGAASGGGNDAHGGGAVGSGNGPSIGTPSPKPMASRTTTTTTGSTPAAARGGRGGVPDYQWGPSSDINDDAGPRYAAAWSSTSREHPAGLVQLARDFPAIGEVKKYWRDQYPDHLGDRIDGVVEDVYGKALVARIAHSEALVRDATWGRSLVESELRSPAALTMALLGLVSEDAVISARLTGLGVRRRA